MLELIEERSVPLTSKSVGSCGSTLEEVYLTRSAKCGAALLVRGRIRRAEELARIVGDNILNVVENISLENSASSGIAALEQVTLDVEPDVVDSMKESFPAESGATASGLGDVVVLHGDRVASTDHLEDPVVISVAASRVFGGAIDEVAGESDTGAGRESENVVLAAWTSSLANF
jgi:hypothetical protein